MNHSVKALAWGFIFSLFVCQAALACEHQALGWVDGGPLATLGDFQDFHKQSTTAQLLYEHGTKYRSIVALLLGRPLSKNPDNDLSAVITFAGLQPAIRQQFYDHLPHATSDELFSLLQALHSRILLIDTEYDPEGTRTPYELSIPRLRELDAKFFSDFNPATLRFTLNWEQAHIERPATVHGAGQQVLKGQVPVRVFEIKWGQGAENNPLSTQIGGVQFDKVYFSLSRFTPPPTNTFLLTLTFKSTAGDILTWKGEGKIRENQPAFFMQIEKPSFHKGNSSSVINPSDNMFMEKVSFIRKGKIEINRHIHSYHLVP